MPRQSTRFGITEALALAGVQETQRGAQVSEDIQMVYLMDDLRGLLAPVPRPFFVATDISPVNILRRGFIEIIAPADSAVIVPWFRNDDAGNRLLYNVDAETQITNDLAAQTPAVSVTGAVHRARYAEGTGANLAQGIILPAGGETAAAFPPIVLSPGRSLNFRSNAVNDAVEVTMGWYEIPLRAATTPA